MSAPPSASTGATSKSATATGNSVAAKQKRTLDALGAFLGWVAKHRGAPGGSVGPHTEQNHECYAPGDPEAGWCDGMLEEGPVGEGKGWGYWDVRYQKDDPKRAFRFAANGGAPMVALPCDVIPNAEQLGKRYEALRAGRRVEHHCRITAGSLADLEVLTVSAPMGSSVSVFSKDFRRLPSWQRVLDKIPTAQTR